MKILFLNYEYPPLGGGAANATANILKEYAELSNLSVDLVTSSIDSEYHLEKIGDNVRIHRLPIGKNPEKLHFQSQKDLLMYIWKAYWFSKKMYKKSNFDLSHSFFTVPSGFISLLLKWHFSLPYIISLRGSDVPGYSDRFPLIYVFLKPIFKLIWKKSAVVVSCSNGLKDLALKTNSKQAIGVIPNGIDIDQFRPDEEKRNKERFIITPGASRITDRKGLNYLIEAVNKLKERYPQIYLRIMGDGNAKEKLENYVKELGIGDKVNFTGRIPREETLPYYQEASLFIMPSLNEGMSNAMLEALASGLPLVATDTGGARDIVFENINGFFIEMKNADDIATKIERIISDEKLREKMSRESRVRAEKMSWKSVAKEYHNLYQNIINRKE